VALSLILFAAAYLQFILVERPVFLYSALPALPFAYLLIASAAAEVSGGSPRGRMLFAVLAAGAVLWGLYIYPLVTGRMVPAVLYDFLLPG
jgi:dolichyl-phosphate-mannose--protein O-mannosyl transferase